MDSEFKRTIILENYQNPKNRGIIDDLTYKKISTKSESCIDQLDLIFKFERGKIVDVRFDGEACAICTSSTSIMIDILIGKTFEEAIEIIENFHNMIEEKEYDENILKEAIVYSDISKQPNRKQCALLSWEGAKTAIDEERCKNA